MNFVRTIIISFGLCFALTGVAEYADGIVAMVGDHIILYSELQQLYESSIPLAFRDSLSFERTAPELLDRMIQEKIIAMQADKDSIKVNSTEIEERLDKFIEQLKSQFSDEEKFAAALEAEGTSETKIRANNRETVKNQVLAAKLAQKHLSGKVGASDEEVRKYFEDNRETFPKKGKSYHLAYIVITPPADSLKYQEANQKIILIDSLLKSGLSFEDVAKEYSDDPMSREKGGDLGYFVKGLMVPEFEAAAFQLQNGEVSQPIKTIYGFHIIKMIDNQVDSVRVQQILISTVDAESRSQLMESRADSIYNTLIAGSDFAEMVKLYSEDSETVDKGGDLGYLEEEVLMPAVKTALTGLNVGDITKPIEIQNKTMIFKILGVEAERSFTYDEIKDQIQPIVENTKLEAAFDELVKQWQQNYYVDNRLAKFLPR
jgi:peptidyl-prolyl cis-trans isomerase SurA